MILKSSWLSEFIARPTQVASLTQASAQLADRMARLALEHYTHDSVVIELGCGFGAITQRLLEGGVDHQQLVSLDISQRAVARTRHMGAQAYCVDARYLRFLVRDLQLAPCHTIVSSLGLLNMNAHTRQAILQAVDEVLRPGGHFVQYTYGPTDPTKGYFEPHRYVVSGRDFTWKNLPPAHVWRWTKPL